MRNREEALGNSEAKNPYNWLSQLANSPPGDRFIPASSDNTTCSISSAPSPSMLMTNSCPPPSSIFFSYVCPLSFPMEWWPLHEDLKGGGASSRYSTAVATTYEAGRKKIHSKLHLLASTPLLTYTRFLKWWHRNDGIDWSDHLLRNIFWYFQATMVSV